MSQVRIVAYRQLSATAQMALKWPVIEKLLTWQSPPHAIQDARRRSCALHIMLVVHQYCGVCSRFLGRQLPLARLLHAGRGTVMTAVPLRATIAALIFGVHCWAVQDEVPKKVFKREVN